MRAPRSLLLVPAGLAAGLLLASAASAERARLLPPQGGDLVPRALQASATLLPDVSREPVRVAFPIDPSSNLADRPAPPVAESRDFFLDVDATQLVAGVVVHTTASGAIVRVNPVGSHATTADALALALPSLVVVDDAGTAFSDGRGVEALADAAALNATGARFPENTVAFRVASDVGAGRLVLRVPELTTATGARYQVHVYEPSSSLVLQVGPQQGDHLTGGRARFDVRVHDGATPQAAQLEGFVTAGSGDAWPVAFERRAPGVYQAAVDLPASSVVPGRLWQVHVRAEGAGFLRHGRAPFAVAVPSARLMAEADVEMTAAGLDMRFGVEVAAAGRYAVRGVLYATGTNGDQRPIAHGESATWIESGRGQLRMQFDDALLTHGATAGFGPPYVVRDLTLLDQGRLAVVQRQAQGLTIP